MTITIRPRWSLGRGKTLVPSRWQATAARMSGRRLLAWAIVSAALAILLAVAVGSLLDTGEECAGDPAAGAFCG